MYHILMDPYDGYHIFVLDKELSSEWSSSLQGLFADITKRDIKYSYENFYSNLPIIASFETIPTWNEFQQQYPELCI